MFPIKEGLYNNKLSKKGLSPLVAAVLLIAVTMTIAGLLAYWAASFVGSSLPETNITDIECRSAIFEIYSCTYNSESESASVILRNRGDSEIKGLKAFIFYINGSVSDAILMSDNLPSGGSIKSYNLEGIEKEFSKLSISTSCPDVSAEKTCAVI